MAEIDTSILGGFKYGDTVGDTIGKAYTIANMLQKQNEDASNLVLRQNADARAQQEANNQQTMFDQSQDKIQRLHAVADKSLGADGLVDLPSFVANGVKAGMSPEELAAHVDDIQKTHVTMAQQQMQAQAQQAVQDYNQQVQPTPKTNDQLLSAAQNSGLIGAAGVNPVAAATVKNLENIYGAQGLNAWRTGRVENDATKNQNTADFNAIKGVAINKNADTRAQAEKDKAGNDAAKLAQAAKLAADRAAAQRAKADGKAAATSNKDWDTFSSQALLMGRGVNKTAQQAQSTLVNADRAFGILNSPRPMTSQDANTVAGDLSQIFTGKSATEMGIKEQTYNTGVGALEKVKQYITGNPSDVVPDNIKQHLMDVLKELKQQNVDILGRYIGQLEQKRPDLVSSHADQWNAFRTSYGLQPLNKMATPKGNTPSGNKGLGGTDNTKPSFDDLWEVGGGK